MAYQAWSVVFGEQPSASKWNILGQNDASFNDGTGIGSGVITAVKLATSSVTPAKWDYSTLPAFCAYPSASQTLTGGAAAVVLQANTEVFDNNSNYNNSTYTFTAPTTGLYEFFVQVLGTNGVSSRLIPSIKVNSTTYAGTQMTDTFSSGICQLLINLTANDTVQALVAANPSNIGTSTGVANTRFSGKRIA